ncbi:MAG: hypothetical protein AB1656_04990 [Candidatus Omnitrophota bacterium]
MGGMAHDLIEAAAYENLVEDAVECAACESTQFIINRRETGIPWVECSHCGARFLLSIPNGKNEKRAEARP